VELERFYTIKQSVSYDELLTLVESFEDLSVDLEFGNAPKDWVQVTVNTPLGKGFNYVYRTFNLPVVEKRTLNYYVKKINQTINKLGFQSQWENLTTFFKENLQIQTSRVYYTSFGFSIDCFGRSGKKIQEIADTFRGVFDKEGIVYKNEFSDAFWVYRFRFSQGQANLKRIESFLNNIKEAKPCTQ